MNGCFCLIYCQSLSKHGAIFLTDEKFYVNKYATFLYNCTYVMNKTLLCFSALVYYVDTDTHVHIHE